MELLWYVSLCITLWVLATGMFVVFAVVDYFGLYRKLQFLLLNFSTPLIQRYTGLRFYHERRYGDLGTVKITRTSQAWLINIKREVCDWRTGNIIKGSEKTFNVFKEYIEPEDFEITRHLLSLDSIRSCMWEQPSAESPHES